MSAAPGVIKLLGEHAVVYGKLSLAAAITLYAHAYSIKRGGDFSIKLKDFNKEAKLTSEELDNIYASYRKKKSFEEYAKLGYGVALPYATIASIMARSSSLDGLEIEISSEIPVQKGYASSAACSLAFALELAKHTGTSVDSSILEIAREGDKVIHKSEGAGKIDINTSFYGGIVSYSSEKGARKESIDVQLNIYIVDTGPKKSTAETVGHVRELYEKDRQGTERILNEIDACSRKGIELLKKGDKKGFGKIMYRNQELLNMLGVSSEGIELVVKKAKENNLLGAKLSGGGGGGIAIILADDDAETRVFSDLGFEVKKVSIDYEGAKS
ncbi:MAG: mevalonate kinase [Candidatus Micrarchaeia archaeon]